MPAWRARSRSIIGSPLRASARSNSPPTSIDWMPRLFLVMRLSSGSAAFGCIPGEMPPGDVAEGQRGAERNASAGIVAAHDARHVIAGGIKPRNDAPVRVERARMCIGDD